MKIIRERFRRSSKTHSSGFCRRDPLRLPLPDISAFVLRNERQNLQNNIAQECGAQLSAILYPRILPTFMQEHPEVKLKLVEDHFVNLCTQLSRGELDLVVANRTIEDSMIDSVLLYREEIGLVAPDSVQLKATEDPSRSYPVVNTDELRNLPFILVKQGQNLRRSIDELFAVYDINPKIILETNNWDTCYRMVAQNIGFTMIPFTNQFISLAELGVRRYSLPGMHYRDVRIFWSKRSYRPASMSCFVELCRECFSGGNQPN